ncbi:MAG: hypothetical protein M1816_005685 [Peltula sp. TS41687]|nr:MAG: hypothetical protein M1816_005685 [Peltula sp. TS41687]
MEALVAVGLASNVLQFVQFAVKLVSKGKEIYDYGSTVEQSDLRDVTKQLVELNDRLRVSLQGRRSRANGLTDDEKGLENVAASCITAGNDLIQKLSGLQINSRHRRWRSIRQALKTVWKKDDIDALTERLRGYERPLAQYRLGSMETKLDASCERNAEQVENLRSDNTILGRVDDLHDVLVDIRNTIEQPRTRHEAKHEQSTSVFRQTETQMIDSSSKPTSHASVPTNGQYEMMLGMIQKLQEQIAMQSNKMDSIVVNGERERLSKKVEVGEATEDVAHRDTADTLAKSKDLAKHIKNLSRFASREGTVMLFQHAESLIESLDKILGAFAEADKARMEREQRRKRKRSDSLGADVPVGHKAESERDIKRIRGMLATVQHFGINDPSISQDSLGCCRKLLLQAGADPMVNCSNHYIPKPKFALIFLKRDLKMILDTSGELIDINDNNPHTGISALGYAARVSSGGRLDCLDLLLTHGANPLVLQQGKQTCLHLAVVALGIVRTMGLSTEEEKSSLMRLMNAIAKAKATKEVKENVTLEEQLGLSATDQEGKTPLSLARELCLTRQRVFQDVLAQYGVVYNLPAEGCPNKSTRIPDKSHKYCFCWNGSWAVPIYSSRARHVYSSSNSDLPNWASEDSESEDNESDNSGCDESEGYLSLVDYYASDDKNSEIDCSKNDKPQLASDDSSPGTSSAGVKLARQRIMTIAAICD